MANSNKLELLKISTDQTEDVFVEINNGLDLVTALGLVELLREEVLQHFFEKKESKKPIAIQTKQNLA